jgi:hypothetical protein
VPEVGLVQIIVRDNTQQNIFAQLQDPSVPGFSTVSFITQAAIPHNVITQETLGSIPAIQYTLTVTEQIPP